MLSLILFTIPISSAADCGLCSSIFHSMFKFPN
jgi:hypothetical protein